MLYATDVSIDNADRQLSEDVRGRVKPRPRVVSIGSVFCPQDNCACFVLAKTSMTTVALTPLSTSPLPPKFDPARVHCSLVLFVLSSIAYGCSVAIEISIPHTSAAPQRCGLTLLSFLHRTFNVVIEQSTTPMKLFIKCTQSGPGECSSTPGGWRTVV